MIETDNCMQNGSTSWIALPILKQTIEAHRHLTSETSLVSAMCGSERERVCEELCMQFNSDKTKLRFAVGGWYSKEEQKCSELSAQWMKKLQN